MIRTGIGYDVHRLIPGRELILGGVAIPHHHGLDGHSDADVLCHAIADCSANSYTHNFAHGNRYTSTDRSHTVPPVAVGLRDTRIIVWRGGAQDVIVF